MGKEIINQKINNTFLRRALKNFAAAYPVARAKAFDARVRDVTEVVASLDPVRATRHPIEMRVAYHDACHLAHAQGVRQPPRDVLASIPGVTIVPIADGDICCGSAGIFNLVQPEMAAELGRRKVARAPVLNNR